MARAGTRTQLSETVDDPSPETPSVDEDSKRVTRTRSEGQLPRLPALGLVPWFAFFRRALIFFLSVRFDMGDDATGRWEFGPMCVARSIASPGW